MRLFWSVVLLGGLLLVGLDTFESRRDRAAGTRLGPGVAMTEDGTGMPPPPPPPPPQ